MKETIQLVQTLHQHIIGRVYGFLQRSPRFQHVCPINFPSDSFPTRRRNRDFAVELISCARLASRRAGAIPRAPRNYANEGFDNHSRLPQRHDQPARRHCQTRFHLERIASESRTIELSRAPLNNNGRSWACSDLPPPRPSCFLS